jgi:NAD(P)-dependent dehydrogenase (short-subunit alcohol dehydrogenase family)
MELKDKIVVITGSSLGIGAETAKLCAKKGANVVVTYNLDKAEGEKVLRECRKYSDSVMLHLDVKDAESIKGFRKQVIEKFGQIDVLINDAGVIRWKKFIDHTNEDIDELIKVNYTGMVKVTRAFIKDFYEQGEGIIVNMASGAGEEGYEDLTVYCGTKFAVRGFTQALAAELPKGIRVYAVNPGMTATRMTNYQGMDPKKVAEIVAATAEEKLDKKSGSDIDVWEYVKE